MLFSCLISAGRLDSAGDDRTPASLLAYERLSRLRAKIAERASEVPDGIVKDARARVLEACLAAGSKPEALSGKRGKV